MKILTICPTKGRPELCKQMAESFNRTKEQDNTLVLGLDVGDEYLPYYREIQEHKIACRSGATVTEVINDTYAKFSDYDFFHIVNDDVIYHTKGWDTKFVKMWETCGEGIFYGNDLFQQSNLPTFPFISGKIARATGWLQLPTLNRYYGDSVWKMIGEGCDCLYYLGGVIIEHKTWFAGKSEHKYDEAVYIKDSEAWANWLRVHHLDVNKVKEAINASKSVC